MCTYQTASFGIEAHGKGVADWIPLTRATVYYDHPISAPLDHALVINFVDATAGPGSRVAVELSVQSARELAEAIQEMLRTEQAQKDLAAS